MPAEVAPQLHAWYEGQLNRETIRALAAEHGVRLTSGSIQRHKSNHLVPAGAVGVSRDEALFQRLPPSLKESLVALRLRQVEEAAALGVAHEAEASAFVSAAVMKVSLARARAAILSHLGSAVAESERQMSEHGIAPLSDELLARELGPLPAL